LPGKEKVRSGAYYSAIGAWLACGARETNAHHSSGDAQAVRHAYDLREVNDCEHCKQKGLQDTGETKLYYLV
jgi:hypothetical protein